MKALKITFIVLGLAVVLIFILFGIYLLKNRQGVATPFEVNTPGAATKVLIASQGSDFKDGVVQELVDHFAARPVYFKVIDVSGLASIREDDWDALVLIHTTERFRLQPDVKEYLDRAQNLDKVILLTTSGSGNWKTNAYDVDIITSASKASRMKQVTETLARKLNALLNLEPEGSQESDPVLE